ncbi:hypothetical protein PMAYCL1PPCAC_09356, partial [Pristionchus mayeri]
MARKHRKHRDNKNKELNAPTIKIPHAYIQYADEQQWTKTSVAARLEIPQIESTSSNGEAGNESEEEGSSTGISMHLQIFKTVSLPRNTKIYVTENQTIFYHYCPKDARDRLFAIIELIKVEAALIHYKIHSVIVLGNDIYFSVYGSATGLEVCKASLRHNCIEVTYTRNEGPNESFQLSGISSRKENGKTFVNRISDNPDDNLISVDLSANKMLNTSILGIHRRKVFFSKRNYALDRPVVKIVADHAILLESPYITMYSIDASPFCYFVLNGSEIHILDTQAMEFNTILKIRGVRYIRYISNIQNEWMTLYASDSSEQNCEYYIARLPTNY